MRIIADANGRPTSGPPGPSGGVASATATKPLNLTLSAGALTGSVDVMTGASSVAPGVAGVVPAPAAGEDDEILHGDGSFRRVDVAELQFTAPDKIATRTAAGAGAGVEVDCGSDSRSFLAQATAALKRIALGLQIGVDVAAFIHSHTGLLSGLTAGKIPKATSATAVGDSPLYTDGTSLALGNTSPSDRVHVTTIGTQRAVLFAECLGTALAGLKASVPGIGSEYLVVVGYGGAAGLQVVNTNASTVPLSIGDSDAIVVMPYGMRGPVQDDGGAVVNVKAHGVVGDGGTNDTTHIQACVDAMTSGQTLFFPEGRYRISSTITIGDGSTSGASSVNHLTFRGAGYGIDVGDLNPGGGATVFEWTGAAGDPMFKVNGPIIVHLLDFDLLGTAGGNTCGNGIELYYAMRSTVERVSIRRHGGIGIKHTGYATRPTGASSNGANLMLKQVFAGFGNGTAWTGLELGDVGAGGDPCQVTASGCAFNGGLNGDAVRLRYTDNNSFRQCTLSNYAGGATLRIKPVTGKPLFPAENVFYNCPMVANSAALTVVIDESDQAWVPYLTTISFWPFPVGDAWGLPPLPTDVRLSGITDSGIMFGKSLTLSTHLDTTGTQPTVTLGPSAGTGATVTRYECTDTAGLLLIHTGTGPTAPDLVATVTFARAYGVRGHVMLHPYNGAAAALSGATQVHAAGSAADKFYIYSGSSALAAGTDYYWTYHVIGA